MVTVVASRMNKVFLSVSDHLPRLNTNHKVSTVNEEIPDQYMTSVFTTLKALESFKVNNATRPDNIPALVLRNQANVLAPPLTVILTKHQEKVYSLWN